MYSQQLYFSPHGRINREIYWKKWVIPFLLWGSVINLLCYSMGWLDGEIWLVDGYVEDFLLLMTILGFEISDPTAVAQIKFWTLMSTLTGGAWWAVLVKRLHDRGRSAWFLFLGLIPVIGPIWITIECGFLSGDQDENEFGLPEYQML
ncbi:hypothetical protein R50073_34020 [Maricurvus nonylphenolicus]|uniref:DUF805 domain-containing protein n=1 Tax=Maricurvus nonylphenolicus TaxID=1008307 RepID=UPI0036F43C5D